MSSTSTFDGEFVWPAPETVTVRHPTSINGFEDIGFVQLSDRRILVVYTIGGKIYEAYAPNIDTILEQDNWIDDPAHAVSQAKTEILPGHGTPRISLTEVDGQIYLAVLDNVDPNGQTSIKVYRRGGPAAWVLHGAGPSSPWVPSSFGFIGSAFFNVGQIHVHTNGVWVMPASQIFRDSIGGSSFHDWHAALVASTNAGVTWNWVFADGGGSGRLFQQAIDIQEDGGVLYWSYDQNVGGTFIQTSTTGLSWTNTYISTNGGPDGSMQVSPLLVDDNYFYFAVLNGNAPAGFQRVLYRTTNIFDRDTWEVVYDYNTLSLDFGLTHMARLGNYYLWSDAAGRVVGIPVGGCVPHAAAMARPTGGHVRVLTEMVRVSRIMLQAAVSDSREKCAPCSPANGRASVGRMRARLKKVF